MYFTLSTSRVTNQKKTDYFHLELISRKSTLHGIKDISKTQKVKDMRECQVCNSTENILLKYGIFACSACVGFFKRYTTSRTRRWSLCLQDCDVKKCRYCRLKKCLQAGMNKSRVGQKISYGPKHYTDHDIEDILHNANIQITHTYTSTIRACKVCSRELRNSTLPVCEPCRDFFRKSRVEARKCKKEKHCKLHFTLPRLCNYCRYEKCLSIGWKRSIKQDGMIEKSTSIVDKPLKSDYKDNMIKPDTSVDFRKKRLAVACAIAEKENKFMVSFAFLVLKLFKQISVP